jgi:hypothetical protein
MSHRQLAGSVVMIALLSCGLVGCSRFYWSKPGSTAEEFDRDNMECAREASPPAGAQQRDVVVDASYRACLTKRGYTREKLLAPPPPGSYRGIE